MSSPRIDFERFVQLTAAIAAAVGCTPPARSYRPSTTNEPTSTSVPIADPEPDPDPVAEPAVEPVVDPNACNNDVGDVSCAFIDNRYSGPQCEGFSGTCELLQNGYGYRKRPAAAVARCFAERGASICNMRVRHTCFRQGIHDACPDPSFNSFCEDAIERCRARHVRPDYDVAECVQALSSLEGENLSWAKDALGPSAEGCKLMFPVY